MYYDLVKSLHLIAVISWMVGLLYLPRLFVYHNDTKHMSEIDETFLLMEYRLLKFIMLPAALSTYVFGFIMLYENLYLLHEIYFIVKSLLVIIMTIIHFYLSVLYKNFKKGYRKKRTIFYRIINEVPTLLMISIILLIIVKPDLLIF